ncbi:MAG: UDP-galactopyranose mutase [Treponemataceae bacterium]|nr:MAG: UDP-galactopyranose mutase [Treponemataceae bacterium]
MKCDYLYDYLVIGSGLFGATFAHQAHKAGKHVLVVEKRSHTGGNIYCETLCDTSASPINVHKYGAHIFHTSNKKVWDFVNSFVAFNRYTNSPIANYNDALYNMPFNMNTFYALWGVKTPAEALAKIEEEKKSANISAPRNLEEQAITLVGRSIYEILVKGYTEKQWGRKCTDLPPFIIKRLPVRFTFDNNYFNDIFQGIPIGGYNKLTEQLLDDIEVRTNTDFFTDSKINRDSWETVAKNLVFTGKIDEFYGYRFGALEYRTIRLETEVLDNCTNFQGNAVVNYTDAQTPYTRIIEHKHFEALLQNQIEANPQTVISREYPSEWREGAEPFYPINDEKNNELYQKYAALASTIAPNGKKIIFGGRLAEYKYYDMDKVIERALEISGTVL